METIFIQIASYRDPELIPTIDDLLDNAQYILSAWSYALHISLAPKISGITYKNTQTIQGLLL